ncbi:MAG: type II secretion system protein [Candidatus Saccharimonadales bacterium]
MNKYYYRYKQRNNSGFTILELILFIAISSLMLTIAFTSVAGRTQQAQFNDSVRTLESQLRRHVTNVSTGLNLRGNVDCVLSGGVLTFPDNDNAVDPGRNVSCVANGMYMSFDLNRPGSYVIQSAASTIDYDSRATSLENLVDKLVSMNVGLVPSTRQEVDVSWGTEYIGGFVDINGSVTEVADMAFLRLRAVDSSSEYMFAYSREATETDIAGLEGDMARFRDESITPIPSDTEYGMCFESTDNDLVAIVIGADSQFSVVFNDLRCQ